MSSLNDHVCEPNITPSNDKLNVRMEFFVYYLLTSVFFNEVVQLRTSRCVLKYANFIFYDVKTVI
jgi:hypothetical protein